MKRYIKSNKEIDYYAMYEIPHSLEELKEQHPYDTRYVKVFPKSDFDWYIKEWWDDISEYIPLFEGDHIDRRLKQELRDIDNFFYSQIYYDRWNPYKIPKE